ncbi:hypothetical protein [Phormidium tenue]|uniref:hypothetical protein n=1 Tax=Phormidium tenue TaxID=126344 RepID=UPI0011151E28|nr:hypothetical protein [Phormidium tenue]MBD2232486.1 hypothetical protein [Phormidium tenue FACHB-1052]
MFITTIGSIGQVGIPKQGVFLNYALVNVLKHFLLPEQYFYKIKLRSRFLKGVLTLAGQGLGQIGDRNLSSCFYTLPTLSNNYSTYRIDPMADAIALGATSKKALKILFL